MAVKHRALPVAGKDCVWVTVKVKNFAWMVLKAKARSRGKDPEDLIEKGIEKEWGGHA